MPSLTADTRLCVPADLQAAVEWLHAGGVVAVPTDTFYGFAVDPGSTAAIRQVFDLKGRQSGEALPLIAASVGQVEAYCGPLTGPGARLAGTFWPGPLSLILDAPPSTAPEVHAGHGTVAIRVPRHRVAQCLCEAWGGPLTATSANRSGAPPATRPEDLMALADDGRVLVVRSGASPGGEPSTIVDVRSGDPVLVRGGAIAWDHVLRSLDG